MAYLYQSIFNRSPTSQIVDLYINAHSEIDELKQLDKRQIITVTRIVSAKLDAVGIEPWLRTHNRRHVLSIKLLLIMYLAESDANHPEFRRHSVGSLKGYKRLVLAGLKGFTRMIIGSIQKAIYGIV
jgi:hypothetical protein